MAILNVIKYDGPNNVLVWKWRSEKDAKREESIRLGSQLVVNESQEAVFFKGGKALDVFGPGTHTLSTQNLPFLGAIIGMAFGGDSPFTAEVWFVNKATSMNVKWGIPPFNMVEPNFKVPVPISSRGSFAVKVIDTRNFLMEIVGTDKDLDTLTLKEKFRGIIVNLVKSAIFKIAQEQKLSPVELESIVYQVTGAVHEIIAKNLERYGLSIDLFVIEAIPVIDDDPRVKQVIENLQAIWASDMEERMRLKRRAENLDVYRVERAFDTTETAASNLGQGGSGGSGEILSTFVGLGAAASIGGQIGGLMSNTMNAAVGSANPLEASSSIITKTCPNCSTKVMPNSSFCFSCGTRISSKPDEKNTIVCDKCGESSPQGTKFCPKCGDAFILCPTCKKDNPENSKFCVFCGNLMSNKCTNCGIEFGLNGNFCPNCGLKVR